MTEEEKIEVLRKLEEMSTGCLAMARNADEGHERRMYETMATCYEHAMGMVNGTDQSGPGWKAARDEINRWGSF